MDTDIYIAEKTGNRSMRIPWIPESIIFDSNGTRFAKYEVLKAGEVYVPSGVNIHGYSWKSILPGEGRKDNALQRGAWQDPLWYQQIWSSWRNNGTPLHLLVTGTPINHDVYLEDYAVDYEGAFGDYDYTIKFVDARTLSIDQQASTQSSGNVQAAQDSKGTITRSETDSSQKTYTIKAGDTLWAIAERFLGSGAQWNVLYELNKTAIEQAAKQAGNFSSQDGRIIISGTTLTIRK